MEKHAFSLNFFLHLVQYMGEEGAISHFLLVEYIFFQNVAVKIARRRVLTKGDTHFAISSP